MKAFEPEKSNIYRALGTAGTTFIVPRYQRAYTWGTDFVQALWEDVMDPDSPQSETDAHYIGTVVLNLEEEATLHGREIVDGQQRMLSITLFFCAIRDLFTELGAEDLARATHGKFIAELDLNNQPQFKVTPGASLQNYFKGVQQWPNRETRDPQTDEENNVKRNYEKLRSLIEAASEWGDAKTLEEKVEFLKSVRDRLKNTKLLILSVYSDEDAFTLFETLNARAAELSEVDLTKNLIYKKLSSTLGEAEIESRWERLAVNLTKNNVADFSATQLQQFFRHYWWSKKAKIPEKKIFRQIKSTIPNFDIFLRELEEETKLYGMIKLPAISDWGNQNVVVYKSLLNLSLFGFSQVNILLLSLVRLMQQENYNQFRTSLVHRTFKLLENFTFAYAFGSRRSPSVVERLYSRFAIEISKVETKQELEEKLRELWQALDENYPVEEEFIENFLKKMEYTEGNAAKNSLVKYILGRVNYGGNSEQTLDNVTIEHVQPTNPREDSRLTASDVGSYVNRLGNLSILGPEYNIGASNKQPVDKLEYYKKSTIQMTNDLAEEIAKLSDWTEEDIDNRGARIAGTVWSLLKPL